MKRLKYFFIYILFMSVSCTKTLHDVHFHGRITLECNNQIPVRNCKVNIYREYDKGTHQGQTIGSTLTDNDGYYSFITNVKQKGSFMHYDYSFNTDEGNMNPANSSPQFYGSAQSSDNDSDIEVNLNAERNKAYKFHIKNVSPANSSDIFNSLIVSHLNANNYPLFDLTTISNLTGTNVDMTTYQFYSNQPLINYKYSYTKNGVLTSVPPVSLSVPSCLDTVNVDIFY